MIRLSKSSLSSIERVNLDRVLESEFLGMGAEVKFFEEELSDLLGRPVCCVNSGTAALHLALQALSIGPGDEVLVPTITYVASFQAISATGAKPVACDIQPETLHIDYNKAASLVTSATKAVMPVHYAGRVVAPFDTQEFAQRFNLRVVEDAAHAFGSKYNDSFVGSFGDVVCFSFDGIKNITCGEGGCIVTNDSAVIERVKNQRLLGVEKDTERRFENQRSWNFEVSEQGWRYHMSDINAAIGRGQLKRSQSFFKRRQKIADLYRNNLSSIPDLKLVMESPDGSVPHIFPVILPQDVDRNHLRAKLADLEIQTGIHYQPNHLLKFYRQQGDFSIAEKLYSRILSLPMHFDLSDRDVAKVSRSLLEFLQ